MHVCCTSAEILPGVSRVIALYGYIVDTHHMCSVLRESGGRASQGHFLETISGNFLRGCVFRLVDA